MSVLPVSIRRLAVFSLAVALHGAASLRPQASGLDQIPPPLAIRITSPLGRTGTTGAIRIVAQVSAKKDVAIGAVRFYVDNALVGEDPSGPPFAVEWTDENPFEAREIRVDVADSDGNVARDNITLKPLEIVERTEISSVLRGDVGAGQDGPFHHRASTRRCSRSPRTTSRRNWTSSARSSCRRPTRCSSTAARACRAVSTSSATPRRSSRRFCARRTGSSSRRFPARSAPSPALPTTGPPWPTRSRRSSPKAARPFSIRWRTPPG